MNSSFYRLSAFCAFVLLASTAGPAEHGSQLSAQGKDTGRADDLEWLVGKWKCITRAYFSPQEYAVAASGDNVLEYFNVYFPYTGGESNLNLSLPPTGRRIAAEFLVRHLYTAGEFREQLRPMFEPGPVAVTPTHVYYGFPLSDDFVFSYSVTNRSGEAWLTLKSRAMAFELIKVTDNPGNIAESFVTAPIREYSPERVLRLREEFERLKKSRGAGPPR